MAKVVFKVTGDLDFRFTTSGAEPLLSGHFDFGHPRPDSMDFGKTIIDRMDYCASEKEYNTGCIEEEHHQRIRVTYESTSLAECYHIVREGLRCPSQTVKDCFDMSGAHWYGGYESFSQVRNCCLCQEKGEVFFKCIGVEGWGGCGLDDFDPKQGFEYSQ